MKVSGEGGERIFAIFFNNNGVESTPYRRIHGDLLI
jgi:hypothetical protein